MFSHKISLNKILLKLYKIGLNKTLWKQYILTLTLPQTNHTTYQIGLRMWSDCASVIATSRKVWAVTVLNGKILRLHYLSGEHLSFPFLHLRLQEHYLAILYLVPSSEVLIFTEVFFKRSTKLKGTRNSAVDMLTITADWILWIYTEMNFTIFKFWTIFCFLELNFKSLTWMAGNHVFSRHLGCLMGCVVAGSWTGRETRTQKSNSWVGLGWCILSRNYSHQSQN